MLTEEGGQRVFHLTLKKQASPAPCMVWGSWSKGFRVEDLPSHLTLKKQASPASVRVEGLEFMV